LETGGKIEMNSTYALHETLETHEIAAFKTVCMTKSKTMQALVSDQELLQILQEDVQLSNRQLQELSDVLSKAIV
jgi:similar to spore coat protein